MNAIIAVLIIGACAFFVRSAEKDEPLIIKHADRFDYVNRGGVQVQKLMGRVEMEHKGALVTSDSAIHFQREERIDFSGRVHMLFKTQSIDADKVTYFKRDTTTFAKGNVVIVDTEQRARITGGEGRYVNTNEESTVRINPVFTRLDSSGKDTMTIVSKVMKHYGRGKKAVAIDSVVMTQGKTRATCGLAEYFKQQDRAVLLDAPRVRHDKNTLEGDTLTLFFKNNKLDHIMVVGKAVARMVEEKPRNPDSTKISILNGDTLFAFLDSGAINRMEIRSRAIGISYALHDSVRINRLTGKYMEFFFSGNAVDSVHVSGNATSLYFYEEAVSDRGKNETSGDSLNIYFAENRVARILAAGGVRGAYLREE